MSIFETRDERKQRLVEEAHALGQDHGSRYMGVWEEFKAKPIYELQLEASDISKAESEAYDAGWKNGRKQRN